VQLFYEDGTRISANSDINVLLKKSEEKQLIQLKNKKTFKEKPLYTTLQKSSS
jgi:hypothetical protein